jgi:GNAT superfamily N-acetyltransferase
MHQGSSAAPLDMPSEGDGHKGQQAAAGDVPRLAAVMAEAFHADPIFGWLIPNESRRLGRLRRFFSIELGRVAMPRGQVWTTKDLSGAALILPPGRWRVPLHVTLLEAGPFAGNLARASRLAAAMEWHHGRQVRRSHYYVREVGVLPKMQGMGLGSALIRSTLERCDQLGLPAYLEATSERSASLYERLGFDLNMELRVAGSPPLWLMLRPPTQKDVGS